MIDACKTVNRIVEKAKVELKPLKPEGFKRRITKIHGGLLCDIQTHYAAGEPKNNYSAWVPENLENDAARADAAIKNHEWVNCIVKFDKSEGKWNVTEFISEREQIAMIKTQVDEVAEREKQKKEYEELGGDY